MFFSRVYCIQEYTFVYRQMWEAPGVSKTASTTSKYLKVFIFSSKPISLCFIPTFYFDFWNTRCFSCIKSNLLHVSKMCPNNFQFSNVYFFSVPKHFQFSKFCSKSILKGVLSIKMLTKKSPASANKNHIELQGISIPEHFLRPREPEKLFCSWF